MLTEYNSINSAAEYFFFWFKGMKQMSLGTLAS